ncbi:MAG: HNH endonuclease signature motif containing protein [Phycisphaerae bacterium]|nr:HNH endonuclease signature motif containing protein [Phycisphaerae bacterium]MDD5239947.1 HNH endonuclease signature motif containing protein [Candidatus Nanoarchaeia archaeon]
MRKFKLVLYYKSDGKCAVCHKELSLEEATVDHIKPKSKGGSDKEDNLRIVCRKCNGRKRDKVGVEKIQSIQNLTKGLKHIGENRLIVLDGLRLGEITKEEIISAINDAKSNLAEYVASIFNELDSIIDDLETEVI